MDTESCLRYGGKLEFIIMSLIISAVICTHNRAECLGASIQSLVDQSMSRSRYEVIIVNNSSTDSTKEVVESFADANSLRLIFEPRLGLSHARNTGWRSARGRYVAYLDDDAIASPNWLSIIAETFEAVKPRPGCVGGKVDPIWEAPRPRWVSGDLMTCLTAIDWADTAQVLPDLNQKWLVGANIAFPVDVLAEVGGFVLGLDRAGKNLLSGGDVFLEKQIVKAGYTCYYQPEMLVRHFTPRERLNQHWFMRRYYWQGLSDAAMQLIERPLSKRERISLVISKLFNLLRSPVKIGNMIMPTYDPTRFTKKCFAIIEVGHIIGLLGAVGKIE